jgi:hypothetical protein
MNLRSSLRSYNPEQLLITTLSVVFVAYIIIRSRFVAMTIDEVATIFNHASRGLWDMVTYQKDATPNNHVFHTLLLNFTTWFLGIHQVTARIPVLLGGVLYLWTARRISAMHDRVELRLFTLTVLLGSHFVVEFFSLARGYGLASACMLASVYGVLEYLRTPTQKALAGSAVMGVLAVWSNFTLLNFYLPYTILMLLLVAQQQSGGSLFRHWALVAAGTGLTALVTVKPVLAMRAADEFRFWQSSGFLESTLRPSVRAALSEPLLDYVPWFMALVVIFCAVTWAYAMGIWIKKHARFDRFTFVSALFLGAFCYNLLQNAILGVPFLDARTSLFFYPMLALMLMSAAHWIWEKKPLAARIYMAVITGFVVLNFYGKASFNRQTEWWFDNGTFVVIDYLERLYHAEKRSSPITLDTSWPMQNSYNFHIKDSTPRRERYIQLPPWHGGREYLGDTEFYVMEGEDIGKFKDQYQIVLTVPNHPIFLFQRKKAQ